MHMLSHHRSSAGSPRQGKAPHFTAHASRLPLTKAGPASKKEAGGDAAPGNKARGHVIRVTTIHAHGLTCKRGGAPAAGRGALLCWGSRMTRKDNNNNNNNKRQLG